MDNGIDKLEIADELMESAIESFLDKKRYCSALNLAGVAQEIYGKWIRINGGKDFPNQTLDAIEKLSMNNNDEFDRKETKKRGNHPKNTIKHLDSADDRFAVLEPVFDSFLQLAEAYVEHKRLDRPSTENIKRFVLHMQKTRNEESLNV